MIAKRTMKAYSPKKNAAPRERGAALILTVIVILVLTTLGIAMVTFTTTEERTASTFRDAAQARMVAEGGVRLVQQMFATPNDRTLIPLYSATGTADNAAWDYWGAGENATETQLNEIGVWRSVRPGASPGRYVGASNGFLRPPFGTGWGDVFAGTYAPTNDVYDLKFNCRNPANNNLITNWATTCWLEKLNAMVDNTSTDWNLQPGRITDVSFYGPPQVNGAAYGIATVRVTAEKRESWPNGTLLARETMVAIIGDATPKPAVFGNGDVSILDQNSDNGCGDGCMNIHANGNVSLSGSISGGEPPMVTATGDAPGTAGDGAARLTAPEINPWDLKYKPTSTAELGKYFLVTARALDSRWRDGDKNTKGANARPCGNDNLSLCQDYNLEYQDDGVTENTTARSATSPAYLYRWNIPNEEWDQCDEALNGDNGLGPGSCVGGPSFSVSRNPDIDVSPGTGDTADKPFNINRVPRYEFGFADAPAGQILLVDGMLSKSSNNDGKISAVAVGTIRSHANADFEPAASNGVMFISGRDIDIQSNCCVPDNNPCSQNATWIKKYSGIWAVHEQIFSQSNSGTTGVIVAENKVNKDTTVNSATQAIDLGKASHAYLCGYPSWPWALPTTPVILSLSTASD